MRFGGASQGGSQTRPVMPALQSDVLRSHVDYAQAQRSRLVAVPCVQSRREAAVGAGSRARSQRRYEATTQAVPPGPAAQSKKTMVDRSPGRQKVLMTEPITWAVVEKEFNDPYGGLTCKKCSTTGIGYLEECCPKCGCKTLWLMERRVNDEA